MTIERKIAEAAKAAAETVLAKSDRAKRKEEAVRTHARLNDLARLADGQAETRRMLEHERYVG